MEIETISIKMEMDINKLTSSVGIVLSKLDEITEKLNEVFVKLQDVVQNSKLSMEVTGLDEFAVFAGLLTVLQYFGYDASKIIGGLTVAFSGLSTALATVGITGGAAVAVIAGIAVVIAGLIYLVVKVVKNWDTIWPRIVEGFQSWKKTMGDVLREWRASISAFFNRIIGHVSSFGAWIKSKWSNLTSLFINIKSKVEPIVKGISMGLLKGIAMISPIYWIYRLTRRIIDGFKKAFGIHSPSRVMMEIGKFIILGLVNGLQASVQWVLGFIGHFVTNVIAWITTNLPVIITTVGAFFATLWTSITTFFTNLWLGITTFFTNVWLSITMFFTNLPVIIGTWLMMVITKLTEFAISAILWVNTNVVTIIDSIVGFFAGLPEKVKEKASEVLTKLGEWVTEAVAWAGENIPTFIDEIMTFFNELPDKVLTAGNELVAGLWEGINEKKDWIIEKIGGFTDEVLSSIKDFFGIASPSKKMMEIGDYLGQGLGIGIDKSFDSVLGKSKKWSSALMSEFGGMNVGLNASGIIGRGTMAAARATSNYQQNYSQTFSPTINVQGGISSLEYRREANRLMRQQAALIARG